MIDRQLNCAECDEIFPEYFEGELDDARRAMVEAHASSCARCQGLIRDIASIQQTAANLPDLAPSRDLWQGIEARIQPPVVSIGERRERHGLSRRMLGLAAAALVVISSSLTYVVTRPPAPSGKKPVRIVEAPRDLPVSTDEIGPAVTPPIEAPAAAAPAESRPSETPRARNASARKTQLSAAEQALAPEIAQLQKTLNQKRDQLDPSTVKVVEDNLALIDAAVKQARAALMRDPASGFLTEQLDNALHKKVELLRTVAMLPSRS
ncbi:MAG TPA: zf-HC2 domain-containing protein [Gemmatimonadaceae bacterium]|nr:zf-HC2 domain-containing protein [Gemmatimonadaceae bacterium]